ncbi:MAG: amidohydrolase family protein [Saprospiraceae bacterium]|nr:amidohydrolase family protein [Candidatus Vicinibacter affinis]
MNSIQLISIKSMQFFSLLVLQLGSFSHFLQAQIPVGVQKEEMAFYNARIHTGKGAVINNGVLIFNKGKISYVGDDNTKVKSVKNATDLQSQEIYPGFIAAGTTLGLEEISAVKATQDSRELGNLNPNLRAVIAYNTDSKVIPTVRSNGVLLAQIAPTGGVISGQSSIVQLDAWNWEDAAYSEDEGVWLNWPNNYSNGGWWGEPQKSTANENYIKEVESLNNYFSRAKAYSKSSGGEINLAFESMKGLWKNQKKLFIRVNNAKAIIQAILFCEQFEIKPVIVGGDDAWKITDFLKARNISIILGRIHSLPTREDENVFQPYLNPGILKKAGILFGISDEGFWQQRNLAFQAGQAVAGGLSHEDAIASVTSSVAEILGIAHRTGSLEVGKDATFFISKGDALDIKSQDINMAFILGRQIDLDNLHKQLYKKYSEKYSRQ